MNSFNRTSMELKLMPKCRIGSDHNVTFNRTSMELKQDQRASAEFPVKGTSFNRTSMELKLSYSNQLGAKQKNF